MTKYSGNFGKLALQYDTLRPKYPKKIISLIYSSIPNKNPVILDLGCGTGISTRQLAKEKGMITGCDVDKKMLKIAVQRPLANISYKKGSAEKLPFSDNSFDAVTSFIAFHWFMNKRAIREIRRVLKKHSVLCIIQPRYAIIQKDFRMILEREIKQKIPKKYKTSTEIIPFLVANGFQTKKQIVKFNGKYTLEQYINLMKSYSLWNYVPTPRKKEIEKLLNIHFSTKLKNGYIRNIKDIEVIIAVKK